MTRMKKKLSAKLILSLAFALLFAAQGFAAGIGENENQSAEFVRMLNRNASTDIDACYFNPAGLVYLKPGWHFHFSNQMITDHRTVKDSSSLITDVAGKPLHEQNYKGKAQTFIYPDLYAAYKKDDMAFYFMFSVIGAGASAFFGNGLPVLDKVAVLLGSLDDNIRTGELLNIATDPDFIKKNIANIGEIKTASSIEGLSYYLNATVGTAYKINSIFSAALGLRFVYDVEQYKVKMRWLSLKAKGSDVNLVEGNPRYDPINVELGGTGNSMGLILGFDIKPHKDVLIGLRGEYYTSMETKLKVTKLKAPLVEDMVSGLNNLGAGAIGNDVMALATNFLKKGGISTKATIPPNLSMGVSYQALEKLRLEASGIYYLNRLTDWGDDLMAALDGKERTKAESYGNGFGVGLGVEYQPIKNLKTSIGMTYSESGRDANSSNEIYINLKTITIGTGATYTLMDDIDITLAGMKVWHQNYIYDNSMLKVNVPILGDNLLGENGQQMLSESTWELAIGLTYRLPREPYGIQSKAFGS